jgi:hypothetical protein
MTGLLLFGNVPAYGFRSYEWPPSKDESSLLVLNQLGGALRTNLKPALAQLFISMVAATILGACAMYLYFFSSCWDGGTDCAAYSLTRRWISFLLAPPIFLMQRLFFGTVDNVHNFDPVIIDRFGWVALWAYYYAITNVATRLLKRWRVRSKAVHLDS